jgi:hypothetical protein
VIVTLAASANRRWPVKGKILRKTSPAMIVACLALLVALGGTSIAAVKVLVPRNSVGTNQVIDHSLLAKDFRTPPRGPVGPRGPAGPAGPAGAAGAAGPKGDKGDSATGLWAVVDSNGTLIRNKGAASALKIATGMYQVVFNQDVTGCSYQATVGSPGNATTLTVGQANVAQRINVAAGVEVWTLNALGTTFADRAFHVAVFCS